MTQVAEVGGDERVGKKVRKLSPLEILIHGPNEGLTKEERAMLRAGERFAYLWHQCRKHYYDAPPIDTKVSNPNRGYGHIGELTDDMVDYGKRVHGVYQEGIREIMDSEINKDIAHKIIKCLIAICVENKTGTPEANLLCTRGLKVLVNLWHY